MKRATPRVGYPHSNPRCTCTDGKQMVECPYGHLTHCHAPFICEDVACRFLVHTEPAWMTQVYRASADAKGIADRPQYRKGNHR